ncbi:MAG: EAL domain-containing protein [Agathobacter sp.]|nr:EAL domain-containing protein [Agathobacter sp.]
MPALEQIIQNCYLVVKVNLTDDTFIILNSEMEKRGEGEVDHKLRHGFQKIWDSYARRELVYNEDVLDFIEYVNVPFIRRFLSKYQGAESYETQFRYKVRDGYKPLHLEIIPAEDYSEEQQNVYMFIKKTSSKMIQDYVHFDTLLRGLSENYGAIYYVDFDKNEIHPFRLSPAIEKKFGAYFRTKPTYEDAIAAYINAVVKEEDKEEMFAVTQYDFLKEQLKDAVAYSHEYRVLRGGRELVFRFKMANLGELGELHQAVAGFADVSAEKTTDFHFNHIGKKILIVEDVDINRQLLYEILSSQYEVLQAANGQEALKILDASYSDIAVVLTDLQMPCMDGYELIKQMKRIRQYSNIPIIVTTGTNIDDQASANAIEVNCFDLGASDFLVKPYNADIVLNRVKSIIRLRESTTMLTTLEKDSLTGLYEKDFFFRKVEQYLKDFPDEDYVMWACDIQGLKVINEKYGLEMGDEVIKYLATGKKPFDGVIFQGRIEGDKFAALVLQSALPTIYEITKKPDMGMDFPVQNVVVKHGLYHIRRRTSLRPQGMYDRALLAIQKIKNNYEVYLAEYDDVLRKELLVQRQVAENAQQALQEHQFVVYYQPKFDLHSNRTNGAEALIRWIHPELGFMNPGVFIPLFEQNGFICKLDYYVWEEVCKTLKSWKEQGMRIVPVSVNVSRRDFEDEFLAEKVIELLDKYGVSHENFHVEVTESAYSDNPQRISETIRKFHENGFIVELDDFGTGYSSMTALSELDLDVMKLDMSLIRNDNPKSDKSVLEFSMQLAKMMQLKTVAEGVETEAQVERISSLGGDYIQGYYYSKPLTVEQFEEYIKNEEQKSGEEKC